MAQEKAKPQKRFWDNVYTGGGLGASFGDATVINASPILGYNITKRLSAGIGITYTYYRNNKLDYQTNIYGGSVFSRFLILENLFAHAEYEMLSFESEVVDPSGSFITTKRINVPSLFVGGGYRQPIVGNTAINLMVLYNLLYTPISPYPQPYVIRMSVDIGF